MRFSCPLCEWHACLALWVLLAGLANAETAQSQDFVYVCTDGGAGAYEAFPDICRLKDGRLMCVFYAGYGHVALPNEQFPKGGRIVYCTSGDEGRTWSEPRVLYDGPEDDRDPSITQLADGRLICTFFSLYSEEDVIRYRGALCVVSDDAGKTWSKPRLIAAKYHVSSPVRELSDGRLILGLYGDAATKHKGTGAVVLSTDGGKTWGDVVEIDNGGVYLPAETDVIELTDGSLFAALRGEITQGVRMHWSRSRDGGKTWTTAKTFGFPGESPYLHRTADGIILVAQRHPSTSFHYSLDECKTWSPPFIVDRVIGAYPSMVNLKDGSVLIVYYDTPANEPANIRAKRFRVTKSGVEWLPLGTDAKGSKSRKE